MEERGSRGLDVESDAPGRPGNAPPSCPVRHHLRDPESVEVLNAGHIRYTIVDEADLLIERAQFAAPDVVVVQVLDNDVYGMLAVMRNVFGRRKHVHGEITRGSEAEARVLKNLLGQRSATQ